jgi:hypothetical protein
MDHSTEGFAVSHNCYHKNSKSIRQLVFCHFLASKSTATSTSGWFVLFVYCSSRNLEKRFFKQSRCIYSIV